MNSLSIFFPCYNDKGTIATMVWGAKAVAEKLTDDFEMIVIDDGSTDGSRELLVSLQKELPDLKLVFHERNQGYGGALRSGFKASTKELVFYTDGDAQYDVEEMPLLWAKMTPHKDIVNGYKIKRHDPPHRIIIGLIYQWVIRFAFRLPIRDIDCDFRLIRRKVFGQIELKSMTGTITVELVKKIENAGFYFAEAPVSHRFRIYGTSQFFNFTRVFKTIWRLGFLWCEVVLSPFLRTALSKLGEQTSVAIVLRRIVELNFCTQKKVIREHLLPLRANDRVLDLGCGTGEFAPLFPVAQYQGIDIDPASIAYAAHHYPYRFQVGDARTLSFPDTSFTKILVAGVLHHLSPAGCARICGEMKRVLTRGGRVLIMEDTESTRWMTRLMYHLDQGAYIRTEEEWKEILATHLRIERHWTFNNGVCFYSAFILTKE